MLRGVSGNYASAMVTLALVLALSTVIVLALRRATASRKVRFSCFLCPDHVGTFTPKTRLD